MLGQSLNHYRIGELLGRGGMGEVYAADDTRLHRRVAIKVLPATVGTDPERHRRFEREAQAVAALNHPNIVTIYSVEQAGDVHFLVMELVEGDTLAALIPQHGLPLDRLLQTAIPLADAVSAAHARGIIHRDLKPANVMVTREGRVKVLDFGLAKLKETIAVGSLTTMPAQEATGEGRVLGTVTYMSPEQAEGREIDHRSDIFSLGVLLYELATGERPFKGETSLSLLASIVKDTPPSVTELNPALPRELGRIVRRCLAKDPGRRYQSAIDLRNELEEIKQELDSGELASGGIVEAAQARVGRRRSLALLVGGLAATTAATALGYFAWRGSAGPAAPVRVERFQLQPPSGVLISESGAPSVLAMSRDGQWVAFRGIGDDQSRTGLYLRSTADVEARLVSGTQPAYNPFFSADSRWLGFFADGAIWKVPIGGGQPQRICSVPRLRGASWSEDGTIVFSSGQGLQRVSANGGDPVTLTRPALGDVHYWPEVLPGGAAAVFTLHQGFSDSWRKIAVVSLTTGQTRILALSGTSPHYVLGGWLVYSRLGTVYAVPFDVERLQVTGEPRQAIDDVYFYGGSGFSAFQLSASGSLAYIPGAERLQDAELVWIDRQGGSERVLEERRAYDAPVASPAGDRIAAHISTTLEESDLWVYQRARRAWMRLTFGRATRGAIVWSPDGKSIVFSSAQSGKPKLFRVLADGSGMTQQLTNGVEWDWAGGVSRDGKLLLFWRQVQASQWDVMTVQLEPLGTPKPFLATSVLEANPTFSPDGRWVAYESDETGSRQIHVRPYPEGNQRITVSTDGGLTPNWSRDGQELFYRRGSEVWSTPVVPGAAFRAGEPRLLFTSDFLARNPWSDHAEPSPDGRFLAVRRPPPERTERLLVYVPNWIEELKQAVPLR